MKNYWVASFFNILLFTLFTALSIFILAVLIWTLSSVLLKTNLGLQKALAFVAISFGIILSNWFCSVFLLKKRLMNDDLWKFSFISGFIATILCAVLCGLVENDLSWVWGQVVPLLAGCVATILFFALINALGVFLANYIFSIKTKLNISLETSNKLIDA